MPIPNEYRDICKMLLEATNEGRVAWVEQSGEIMTLSLKEFGFQLWGGTDEIGQKEFVGVGLKEPSERGLSDNWYVEEGDEDFEMMHMLWASARRQGRKIPKKLDTLRNLLKSGGNIGLKDETVLEILHAQYGTQHKDIDVTDKVRAMVKNNSLTITASNDLAGDPHSGVVKTLTIEYRYENRLLRSEIPEGETRTIPEIQK